MKETFLKNITSWDNYKPLLFLALEETKTGDVVEMGCGESSTKLLHDYCKLKKRKLFSFDYNNEYLEKYKHLETATHSLSLVTDWSLIHDAHSKNASVALIDHSPGEDRGERLSQWNDFKGIIVCHDSEPSPCGGNFGWKFNEWKYVVHIKVPPNEVSNGTWATAVSNEYDLTKWVGIKLNEFEIEK